MAPGDNIISLGSEGQSLTFGGTSVAAPFVTGAIALLWSDFPSATAAQIKFAISHASAPRRASIVPPLLDAATAHRILRTTGRPAQPSDGSCQQASETGKQLSIGCHAFEPSSSKEKEHE
jgi:subtilisin family serine protease